MRRFWTGVATVVVLLLLIAASFAAGAFFVHAVPNWPAFLGIEVPESSLGEQVEEVEQLIEQDALAPSDESSKTAGAIQGLLESLGDPYALYFDPEHFDYFNDQSDGEFYGVGITISERDGKVFVVSVFEDSPAEAAGLEADDEFVTIDELTRETWTLDEVVNLVRGPEGTMVNVTVYRPDDDAELDFEIERAKISIPNVMTRMDGDDVGYIRLLNFNQLSAEDLREALADLESQGAQGFVIDVRDNPGGLLAESVDVASLFIPEGVIVRVEERDNPDIEHHATGDVETDAPIAVLINGNSASASEVFAGAIQDYDRGLIVGETSFGKGSVQTVEPLSFGGAVKFTIAHYLTPLGRVIDGVGLEPDVVIEMDPELQRDEETDTQASKAAELLRQEF
jgi:carboxyl-terminal processing protease